MADKHGSWKTCFVGGFGKVGGIFEGVHQVSWFHPSCCRCIIFHDVHWCTNNETPQPPNCMVSVAHKAGASLSTPWNAPKCGGEEAGAQENSYLEKNGRLRSQKAQMGYLQNIWIQSDCLRATPSWFTSTLYKLLKFPDWNSFRNRQIDKQPRSIEVAEPRTYLPVWQQEICTFLTAAPRDSWGNGNQTSAANAVKTYQVYWWHNASG